MGFHRTPHECVPGAMIGEPVMSRTIVLNWHPAKNGTSKHHSPMTAVTGKKLDFKKHCMVEFGACVQAHNKHDPTDDAVEQASDAMCLQPSSCAQLCTMLQNFVVTLQFCC